VDAPVGQTSTQRPQLEHLMVVEFLLRALGFGIVAPWTMQRTALEKQGRSDAWSILQAEPLNLRNEWGLHNSSLYLLVFSNVPWLRISHFMAIVQEIIDS